MRKIFYFFLAVSSLLLLFGCSPEGPAAADGLALTVDEVSPAGITLTAENTSEAEYGYGAEFRLETPLADGSWSPVAPLDGVSWQQEDWLRRVPSGASKSLSYQWGWYYGQLSPGEYRILVPIKGENSNSDLVAAASFTIS